MKLIVPAKLYDKLEGYVTGKIKAPKEDFLYDADVVMKNGTNFLIQVCGCIDEPPYVQVLVLNKDGHELGCQTDCDSFGGRYAVMIGERKHATLDIVRAKKKVKK